MIKKLLAALFCLSLVSVLSIGVVGCDKKDTPKPADKKEATDKKDTEPKKTT